MDDWLGGTRRTFSWLRRSFGGGIPSSAGKYEDAVVFERCDGTRHRWSVSDFQSYAGISTEEAEHLHKSFGHPSVEKLYNLLRIADPESEPNLRKMLSEISENWKDCQLHAQAPKRFKLSARVDEELRYSHEIQVDVMYISQKPVLHVVCSHAKFQAASFLTNVSTKTIWNTLKRIWMHTFTGPPDVVRVDQGSSFVSKEFHDEAEFMGIKVEEAPIECPTSLSFVERYHGPLRTIYNKLSEYESDKNVVLQQAVHPRQMKLHCYRSIL